MRLEDGERFWEVVLDGPTVHTRHGRVGTDGRASGGKTFAGPEQAAKDCARRLAEQKKKGFEAVSPEVVEPINAELEQAIMDAPADAGRLLVYADWLQGQQHPRGELAAVQHERGQRQDEALSLAEEKLLDKHPTLAPPRFFEMVRKPRTKKDVSELFYSSATWENGFIAKARVARSSLKPPYTVRELVAELLAHPAARFLRELRLGPLGPAGGANIPYAEVLQEIVWARPRALRVLSMVDLPADAAELGFSDLGNLSQLYADLPYLEELSLAGRSMTLGEMSLPRLQRLRVVSSDGEALSSIAAAKWPALTSLTLELGGEPIEEQLFARLVGSSMPALRALSLARTAQTDALVVPLGASGLMRQLERLDLRGGRLSDAGARELAQHAKHLRSLDVSGNELTERGTAALSGACAELVLGPQRSAAGVALSDRDLARLAPDASALAKGREVSKLSAWKALFREGGTYWGHCQGSDLYEVYLRMPGLDTSCSCPSGKRPCKHSIGLALIIASGHAIAEKKLPAGLTSRADAGRYANAWE